MIARFDRRHATEFQRHLSIARLRRGLERHLREASWTKRIQTRGLRQAALLRENRAGARVACLSVGDSYLVPDANGATIRAKR